jgi:hypothetical protein
VRAIEAEGAARGVAYDPAEVARFVEQEFLFIEADPDVALWAGRYLEASKAMSGQPGE